ncbi:hypothetical protein WDV06_09210 [Streptomyces racemochromogenes]|uniref:Uncharacterized protein n=1 Tax=Streptomyces racemochromogenes TaxID=67353 RepID=A0ABW7PA85_9ACTN
MTVWARSPSPATGLLGGRRATNHWRFADLLTQRHPEVTVAGDALYTDEDGVATDAGAAANFDLCLHPLRREHGASTANAVVRPMVLPHREGGQAHTTTTARRFLTSSTGSTGSAPVSSQWD